MQRQGNRSVLDSRDKYHAHSLPVWCSISRSVVEDVVVEIAIKVPVLR